MFGLLFDRSCVWLIIAFPHLPQSKFTGTGANERGCLKVCWVTCALCVRLWMDGFVYTLNVRLDTRCVSLRKHMCLWIVSSWMSPGCHRPCGSLHAADNEHINMYIPIQVNACLALQFHGPDSGRGGFWSINRLWFLFIRWTKKNIVLNYWTDTWLTGQLMKLKGKVRDREARTKIGIGSWVMPKITLVEGLILKNSDMELGCRGGGGLDNIAYIVIWPIFLSVLRSFKSYSRISIRRKIFTQTCGIQLADWLIIFVF